VIVVMAAVATAKLSYASWFSEDILYGTANKDIRVDMHLSFQSFRLYPCAFDRARAVFFDIVVELIPRFIVCIDCSQCKLFGLYSIWRSQQCLICLRCSCAGS
jgi:hypothetical protein